MEEAWKPPLQKSWLSRSAGHGADLVGAIPSSVEVRQQSCGAAQTGNSLPVVPGPLQGLLPRETSSGHLMEPGTSSDSFCFARFKNVKLGRRVGNAFTAGVYFGMGDRLASLKMSWRLTGKCIIRSLCSSVHSPGCPSPLCPGEIRGEPGAETQKPGLPCPGFSMQRGMTSQPSGTSPCLLPGSASFF